MQNSAALGLVPMVETSRADYEKLAALVVNSTLMGTMDNSNGSSPWRNLLGSWWWFLICILMALAGAGCASLAVIRLLQYWQSKDRIFWELPQWCLALEFFGCVRTSRSALLGPTALMF